VSDRPVVAHFGQQRSTPAPVIIAASACNGLAPSAYQTWAFRRAEATALSETPFRLPSGERATMASMRTLPPRAVGAERLLLIAKQALAPVLVALAGAPQGARLALVLGLSERFGAGAEAVFSRQRRELEKALGDELQARGLKAIVHVEPRGHASWAFGVGQAGTALGAGQVDLAIVGGVDSYYDPDVVDLWVERRRLFDGENLDSFIPGEGGAFVLLAPRDVTRQLRWSALGRIESVAMCLEVSHSLTNVPSLSLGLTRALEPVRERLLGEGRTVDWWLSDATSENDRVLELQMALPRFSAGVTGPNTLIDIMPPLLGDLGAASMPTGVAVALEGCWRGDPAARTCLVTGSSAGPERGAVLFASDHG
jgi:3-oxoacyl-[acyl-carrier-protein] synthase-1